MRRWALLAAAVLLALTGATAGCSTGDDDTYAPPTAPPTDEPSIDLAQAKAAAKIADCPTSGDQPARADGLPDVTLPCLGGGRDVRLAGLRGKPMLINFWAQWCTPCRAEAPLLAEVATRAGATARSPKLMILGVDYADPQPGYAIEFAQLAGWRYPQLQDQDKAVNADLPLPGPPQTILVDADGKIVYRHSGQLTSVAQIEQLVRQHLGVDL